MAETGARLHPKAADTISSSDMAEHFSLFLDIGDRWLSGMGFTSTGLTGHIATGFGTSGGYLIEFTQQVDKALAANDTNYIYFDGAGQDAIVEVNQTDIPPSATAVKIWEVTTNGSGVTGTTDFRDNTMVHDVKIQAEGFDANSNPIDNVADPSSAQQAATKNYVDAIGESAGKARIVRVASTTPGTLATSFENGDTVDGVVLATNDEILLTAQSAGEENGPWIVQASGAPVRPSYFDTSAEANANRGMIFLVALGTANSKKIFKHTTTASITLGTTALTFEEASVFGHAATTASPIHGSANAATANAIVHRDSNGRAHITEPSGTGDSTQIVNATWVRARMPYIADVSVQTGNFTAAAKTIYLLQHATPATQLIVTLPLSPTQGQHIVLIGDSNTGGFRIKENGTEMSPIRMNSSVSAGTGSGYFETANIRQSAHLVYHSGAWQIVDASGLWAVS